MRALADLFVPHLAPSARERIGSLESLEQVLRDSLELARGTYGDLALPVASFLSFLARRLPEDDAPERALLELHVADLYLCCACLAGSPQAVALFEAQVLREAQASLARMETAALGVEDIRQMICQKLLVGEGESPAKLERYSGRGDLRSWLCVVAVRTALDLLRKEPGTRRLDDRDLADSVSPEEDQELQYLKQLYRTEFRAAFEEAMGTLTTRERNVLRHQVLDGLTLDQIAVIYNVHRATVARWNAKLREKLLERTREALLARLKTNPSELESIMRLIQSHLDVSIRRHLGAAGVSGPPDEDD